MGLSGSCVPPVAARRFDLLEGFDVGLDDGLQAFCVGRVAEGVGELVETVTIMLLQRTQFGRRVVPGVVGASAGHGVSGCSTVGFRP